MEDNTQQCVSQLLRERFHFVADLWRHFYEPVGRRSAGKKKNERGRGEGVQEKTERRRKTGGGGEKFYGVYT